MITTYGYTITDADFLPPMLGEEEFDTMTANKYAGDARIDSNIDAASEAVRQYCGWHVFPPRKCLFSERLYHQNGRIKVAGRDVLIQLPATHVVSVTSATINGAEWSDYAVETNGVLHMFDAACLNISRRALFEVEYIAGLTDANMAVIKDLVAHRVTHALASSAGVQSESAGGVSVTYSANWVNSTGSTALPNENKDALAPYKLREVF